jgi:hypothetical protein
MRGAGWNRSSPSASTSTSRSTRSAWSIANRAARAPPTPLPTSTGGTAQVCSISWSSHITTALASGGPSNSSEAPRPGRSGPMTRWVVTRSGITRIHTAANSPCSKTIGGPSPPSSTAVETPTSCSRRSVTGSPDSSRSRACAPLLSLIPPPFAGWRVAGRRVVRYEPVGGRTMGSSPHATKPCSIAINVAAARVETPSLP